MNDNATCPRRSVRGLIGSLGAIALALAAILNPVMPACSADVVFPPGSRIGMVPPPGMVTSRTFVGFEDLVDNAAILIAALPVAAYNEMDKAASAEAFKRQGIAFEKREPIELPIGKGFLASVKQTADKTRYHKWILVVAASDLTALVSIQAPEQDAAYSETTVRAALATLTLRPTVPDAERLSLLPFTVGDMAGLRVEDVLPGRALMLVDLTGDKSASADAGTDAANDTRKEGSKGQPIRALGQALNARFLIAALPGGPSTSAERDSFARAAFDDIGGFKDIHVTMAEPLRIDGQPGYETVAQAKETPSGEDVMMVQWLRFGNGGFLQMVGVVRAGAWNEVFKRLRTVRDSVQLK